MSGKNVHTKPARSRASTGPAPDPTPSPAKRVRVKLDTIDDVKAELARLYRQAKGGQVDISTASKLGYLLSLHARLTVDAEIEARLEALEAENENLLRQQRGGLS